MFMATRCSVQGPPRDGSPDGCIFPLPGSFPAVFYDDDLTDALFRTLSRLVHKLENACTAILSVEKR